MVKLVNTQDLGSCAFACGFESHYPHHVGAKPVPCKLRRLKMSRRIFYPCRLPCLRGRAAGRCCCVAKPDVSTRKRLFRSTRSFPVEKTEQKSTTETGRKRKACVAPSGLFPHHSEGAERTRACSQPPAQNPVGVGMNTLHTKKCCICSALTTRGFRPLFPEAEKRHMRSSWIWIMPAAPPVPAPTPQADGSSANICWQHSSRHFPRKQKVITKMSKKRRKIGKLPAGA